MDGMTSSAAPTGEALIVPSHHEGWEHLSESRGDIHRAFRRARSNTAFAGRDRARRWPLIALAVNPQP